jgi:CDP-paratose 2-epimerase
MVKPSAGGIMTHNYFITGGAGFIGANYVNRLLEHGEKVTIYDNLSRAGSRRNLTWLQDKFGQDGFQLVIGDVRDASLVRDSSRSADIILHLAAQVAVTTSVVDPREDFEVNAGGTFNLLEAARLNGRNPAFLYASTNKVYGGMENVRVVEDATRWRYADLPQGCPETQPLDFHSPYGCSKGAGDQYVRDYARIYSLPSVVLRQSCIYGPRQFGVEDQGWLAWMIIAAVTGRQLTIYGDGKQIRDVLHVDDLLDAYDNAIARIGQVKGRIYNLGGGPENTLSVWTEFGPLLEELLGKPIPVARSDWRPGDQKVFVADIRKAEADLGWKPKVGVKDGVGRLFKWVMENKEYF